MVLEKLELIDKLLIVFIFFVFLKMIYDVNRFMKKRKEYLKLKAQAAEKSAGNETDTALESNDEGAGDEKVGDENS